MIDNQKLDEEIEIIRSSSITEIFKQVSFPIISLILALIFGAFILIFLELDPLKAFEKMTTGTLTDKKIANTLFYATPLILTGLSVAIAFRAGMFNIGTEGQMVMGAFLSALVGFGLNNYYNVKLPPIIFIPLLMLAGMLGGALWALVPALLKARGVHEVISTIMMNYIASTLLIFLMGSSDSPFIDPSLGGNFSPQTPPIPRSAWLPLVFERLFSRLHWGFFIGIFVCIIIYIVLWKTRLGYETRAVGLNPNAAKYGGISVNRRLVMIMLISGGLGGLAGSLEVMGQFHMYLDKSLAGYGFDGIAVAIIGGNHPFGVIFGALLFGWLQNVSLVFQLPPYPIPKDVANTVKGFVILLVAVPMISKIIVNNFEETYKESWLKIEVNRLWKRYHLQKGKMNQYFKMEDRSSLIRAVISVIILFLILIWGIFLIFSVLAISYVVYWFLDLGNYIMSKFWEPVLGSEIGPILTEIDVYIMISLILIFIFYLIIRDRNRIFYFFRYSFTFFIEVCFFSLRLIPIGLIHYFDSFMRWIVNYIGDFENWFIWKVFLFIKSHLIEIVILIFFSLCAVFYSILAPDLDALIRSLLILFLLIFILFLYILSRRKLEKRNIPSILFFFGIGFGFIEYLNITDLFRQDIALFSTISLIFAFILFQEFLANKENIKQWISARKSIEINKENRTIIQRYSLFLIVVLILFSLMLLIGETSLPIRFPIPPGWIQETLNINTLFFDLRNYGMLIGIIGLIVIVFGFFNLRKFSLPHKLSEIYFLPYFLISLATIFLFFSLAIFFKFNSFVSFTALIGLLIISTVLILYYEGKNASVQLSTINIKSLNIMKYYTIFGIVLVIITFLMSYFPFYIGSFYFPLVSFALLILIGLIIAFYEWFSWRRHPIPNPKKKDEDKAFYSTNQSLRYHLYFCTILVILSILIFFTGKSLIPMRFNLFFFRLYSIGSLFGILGLITIIIGFIITTRIPKPKKQADIYHFPLLFKIVSVVFAFLALYTFFEMDPFLLISLTLAIAAPIGFASLGGMFSEKSGVVNIGLEGMMLAGAFSAVWLTHETGDPWAGVVGAILAGALMGLLHAVASIKYQANQVVVGVAINLLSSAITTLGIWVVWNSPGQSDAVRSLPQVRMEFLTGIPIIGEFLYNLTYGAVGLSPLVYVFIAMIFVSGWIIQRTTFGLRVRSVGEHPRAADTLGINVYRMRYICVIISGILAAVGGAQLTLGWISVFNKDMTNGRGFVALAALIFGGWHPIGAALASLFFGFAYSFRFQLEPQLTQLGIDWILLDLHLEDLTPTIPFVVTLIAVALVAKRMRPPAADGIPYVKEGG